MVNPNFSGFELPVEFPDVARPRYCALRCTIETTVRTVPGALDARQKFHMAQVTHGTPRKSFTGMTRAREQQSAATMAPTAWQYQHAVEPVL
jgi:hypothetical protein